MFIRKSKKESTIAIARKIHKYSLGALGSVLSKKITIACNFSNAGNSQYTKHIRTTDTGTQLQLRTTFNSYILAYQWDLTYQRITMFLHYQQYFCYS